MLCVHNKIVFRVGEFTKIRPLRYLYCDEFTLPVKILGNELQPVDVYMFRLNINGGRPAFFSLFNQHNFIILKVYKNIAGVTF